MKTKNLKNHLVFIQCFMTGWITTYEKNCCLEDTFLSQNWPFKLNFKRSSIKNLIKVINYKTNLFRDKAKLWIIVIIFLFFCLKCVNVCYSMLFLHIFLNLHVTQFKHVFQLTCRNSWNFISQITYYKIVIIRENKKLGSEWMN